LVALSLLSAAALSSSRLTAVHGVESALGLGLVLPPGVAALCAWKALHSPALESRVLLRWATTRTFVVWLLPTLWLALGSLRVRQCAPLEGFAYMTFGPLVGMQLAAVSGLVVGTLARSSAWLLRHTRAACALAALVPITGLLVGLFRFWSTPTISIYGVFAGWFPGTLYDEDLTLPLAYLSQRAAAVALALGLLACWLAGRDISAEGRLRLRALVARPGLLLAGLAGLSLFGMALGYSDALGHTSSRAHIDATLGRVVRSQRCVVHVPRELDGASTARLLDDCEFSAHQAELGLGVTQSRPVHAFFYRSAEEKRALMGAGSTYIAKPWRDEVHLQLSGWPHPVLAHEVVHAIARYASRGPFAVSSTWGGLLPNPGWIEGVAVAIAWDERDGLNPDQWSAALLQHNALPPVDRFMGLGFTSIEPRRAYSAAGSFVRFLRETEGVEAVREAHRLGLSARSLGRPLSELEQAWHEHLAAVELPPGAMALVALRLTRGSIFETVCPRQVAHLRAQLSGDLSAGDYHSARRTCSELLEIDPNDLTTRAIEVGVRAREGAFDEAEEGLSALREGDAPMPLQTYAEAALADAHFARGRWDQAQAAYERLLEIPQDEVGRRQIEVKLLALGTTRVQTRLLRSLLLGEDGRPPAAATAMHLMRELDQERGDGLAPYLAARLLMNEGAYEDSLLLLRRVERRGLPLPSLERESLRMLAKNLYALERWSELRAHLDGPMQAEGVASALAQERDYWERRMAFRTER
jgi:tetratricopeptide (TPR) repeat protein